MLNVKVITLYGGKVFFIDEEDYERVAQHSWTNTSLGYVVSSAWDKKAKKRCKSILLHRFIMNAPKGVLVDHKNGNRLDNRKENLRFCTRQENARNMKNDTSSSGGHKGVYPHKHKWTARITVNYKLLYLGLFETKEAAIEAYREASIKYFGEFRRFKPITPIFNDIGK